MTSTDVVVVGGGHNGLVTAALLAGRGLKTLVLERSEKVGGCARTGPIMPEFSGPTLTHSASIDPGIMRKLALVKHGLRIVRSEADVCARPAERCFERLHEQTEAQHQ